MPILWRDEMAVGNKDIDDDHRYLISLINVIEAAVNCGIGKAVLTTHVSELFAYTEAHFKKEEEIQAEIKFPHMKTHKQEHADLINQLHAIQMSLETSQDEEASQPVVQGLFDFLRDWLINHIINEDLKMKDYLKPS